MSTREQAILYWIIFSFLLAILFGRKNGILASFFDVVKSITFFLLNPISFLLISINFVYVFFIYFLASKSNLEISLWYIKDYLIALFFSVFPIVETLKNLSFKQFFREKKTELFGLAAIPLFISSNYTLTIGLELILVLVLTLLSFFIAVANQEENTKVVAKFFNFFLLIISLFMIFNSLFQFVQHSNDILRLDFWIAFGLELLVWLINIPVIYLAKKMILVEQKILFSDYKNKFFSYVRYYVRLLIFKIKFQKYRNVDYKLLDYIVEAKELSAIGGNRIFIRVNKSNLSNDMVIMIMSDAILGNNKLTNIINQREKYPNVVEIVDKKDNLFAFWQDSFLAFKWRDTRIDDIKAIELLGGIKVIES